MSAPLTLELPGWAGGASWAEVGPAKLEITARINSSGRVVSYVLTVEAAGTAVCVRLTPEQLAAVGRVAEQPEPEPTSAERVA